MVNAAPAFEFGRNWKSYAQGMGQEEFEEAVASVRTLLGAHVGRLQGARVLDVGCGSGLFSAAMANLGAAEVVSLDLDPVCVETTATMMARMAPNAVSKRVQGSVLDEALMASLGQHDVVYAWGSLHHTGEMWRAVRNAANAVKPGGVLVLALYNETATSSAWTRIKAFYNRSSEPVRTAMVAAWFGARAGVRLVRRKPVFRVERGMHLWTDARDWLGGYPYEAASPGEVLNVTRGLGFSPLHVASTHTLGCNEFVLQKA